jgi:hypothetical protein
VETKEMSRWILRIAIVILALADGVLHLALDLVLFKGRLFQSSLSELFLLNFIGFVALVVVFLLSLRWLTERHWVADVVLIGYAAAAVLAWLYSGSPNPFALGYISKAIEIGLVGALLVDLWSAGPRPACLPGHTPNCAR